MRSTLLAAVVTAFALAAPAHAAPASVSVSVYDPANDWAPSEDVIKLTVTSGPSGRTRVLTATIRLSAAPDPAATYRVNIDTGDCKKSWSLSTSGLGTSNQQASLQQVPCEVTPTTAMPTAPASVKVSGNTVEISAPYALGLTKGVSVTHVTGFVGPAFSGVYVGHGLGQDGFILSGDLAWAQVRYRLG